MWHYMRKKTVKVIIISIYVPTGCNKCLVYMGFIVLSRHTTSLYGEWHNIFVTRLRDSANQNALDSCPIRARLSSQNDELCKSQRAFRKAEHRGATVMYSMWKIMCLFNLKTHKHIALHQIQKIMFFLATSYDPFKQYYIITFCISSTNLVLKNKALQVHYGSVPFFKSCIVRVSFYLTPTLNTPQVWFSQTFSLFLPNQVLGMFRSRPKVG